MPRSLRSSLPLLFLLSLSLPAAEKRNEEAVMMLATLAETVEKTGWQVHAWVWMSNHYHLLVETPEANLVKGMTWFQTTFTTRFNARHHLRGHLFCFRSQSRKNYHRRNFADCSLNAAAAVPPA